MKVKSIITLIFFLILAFSIANAQRTHSTDQHSSKNLKNHISIFKGISTNLKTGYSDIAIALEYEYKLLGVNGLLGFGFISEVVLSNEKEILIALPLIIHPYGHLKAMLAPGLTFIKSENELSNDGLTRQHYKDDIYLSNSVDANSKMEPHFTIRFGVAYDFHINSFCLSPSISTNYVNKSFIVVYGVSFGFLF